MKKRQLPIGTENFEEIIQKGLYYVDKTMLIKELFDDFTKVTLFTRPRRFGKSLNMSMLRYFFELGTNQDLFAGLHISKEQEFCRQHMGQYPVLFLTMKNVEGMNYEQAKESVSSMIGRVARSFDFLQDSSRLSAFEKERLNDLQREQGKLEDSLQFLSEVLFKHYGKKTVILIDEYDVPLDKAYQYGYYEEMLLFIRQMLNTSLKTNDYLEFAVLTGCLRISKDSIFTGLNNLRTNTILDNRCSQYFGFTDKEVRELLAYYGFEQHYEITKNWYDGYRFGDTEVYCPWDVMNWCAYLKTESKVRPQNFWINTSSNDMIVRFAENAKSDTRTKIEALIEGEVVYKDLQLDLTYPEIDSEPEHLWSVLFTTGYLTQHGMNDDGEYRLCIPNQEVLSIFKKKVDKWFLDKVKKDTEGSKVLMEAFENGDIDTIEGILNDCMETSISYNEAGRLELRESFYHGLLVGMLQVNTEWNVQSNHEAGKGRLDIVAYPCQRRLKNIAMIIEIKYAKTVTQLEEKAMEALAQIETNHYDKFFCRRMPKSLTYYGISFCKKECCVKKKEIAASVGTTL